MGVHKTEDTMASVNKAILVGNLGQDPELRYTRSEMAVTTLRIATTDSYRRDGDDSEPKTEWHSVVVFGKTAENCCNFLSKGRQVYVEGRIQTRKWTDKEGNDRYSTEIVANTVQFLGSKRDADGGGYDSSGGFDQSRPSGGGRSGGGGGGSRSGGGGGDNFNQSFDDDDIPF